ncbi:MAG TPA: hypothetical protein H9693_00045 [Firmicutes bacterium]|nr:hypothetical protein [Bacillota bacterium]
MRKSLKNFRPETTEEKCAEEKAAELMKKYGSMSEDALFARLMEEVASEKSGGTFDAAALRANVDKMRPYLTAAQTSKLDHLLRLIGS